MWVSHSLLHVEDVVLLGQLLLLVGLIIGSLDWSNPGFAYTHQCLLHLLRGHTTVQYVTWNTFIDNKKEITFTLAQTGFQEQTSDLSPGIPRQETSGWSWCKMLRVIIKVKSEKETHQILLFCFCLKIRQNLWCGGSKTNQYQYFCSLTLIWPPQFSFAPALVLSFFTSFI